MDYSILSYNNPTIHSSAKIVHTYKTEYQVELKYNPLLFEGIASNSYNPSPPRRRYSIVNQEASYIPVPKSTSMTKKRKEKGIPRNCKETRQRSK